MFKLRFGADEDVEGHTVKTLMGMEGRRVKALYAQMGAKYGVTWKGRDYNPSNWALADNINRAISAANAALYALTAAVVCSMGYLPQLGFNCLQRYASSHSWHAQTLVRGAETQCLCWDRERANA